MQEYEEIRNYCHRICDQIRWKNIHPVICEEMTCQIMDQRDAWVERGMSEEAALHKAIAITGDPVDIGTEFDRVHRPKPQYTMIFLVSILLLTGLCLNLYRAVTSGEAASAGTMAVLSDTGRFYGVLDHFIGCCIGIIVMFLAYYADFTWIGRYPLAFYCSILALTAVTFFFSPEVNGKTILSQYCLLLFPAAYAAFIYSMRRKGLAGILLCGAAWMIPAVIALSVPSLSGLLIFSVAGLFLLCFAISKGWFLVRKRTGFALVMLPALATSAFLCLSPLLNRNSFRAQRIFTILHPESDPYGLGYLPLLIQSKLTNAGWFGPKIPNRPSGTDSSHMTNRFFDDYLLTWLTENLGWSGLILILFLLTLFLGTGLLLWRKQKNVLGQLLALSVLLTLLLQALFYVITNMGLILFGTLCLPFLSTGKWALCIDLGLTGLLLSTFRNANRPACGNDRCSSYRNKPSF